MLISVIVPTLNQAGFIEECLESILSQKSANFEIIVIDGGSRDSTVDILRSYGERIADWESKPDRGQSHAINKGLARASGEVWMYLNSDDRLAPGALAAASAEFEDPSVNWVSGGALVCDVEGKCKGDIRPGSPSRAKDYLAPWSRTCGYAFPFSGACFMRRQIYESIGGFDETLHFSMDIEYYARALFIGKFEQKIIENILSHWMIHPETKTVTKGTAFGFRKDEIQIAQRYLKYLPDEERAELSREIAFHRRMLPVRETMWCLNAGQREQALAMAFGALRASPSLLVSRPWLGAVRRAMLGR